MRSRNTFLCAPVARCGKLLSMGVLASLLVLSAMSAGRADKGGQSGNNGGNGGGGQSDNQDQTNNQGQTKGEAGADRALRLLTLVPVPVSNLNTTAGAMYSFDISYVDQSTQTYYLADRSNKAVDVVDARTGQFKTQIFANPAFRGFTPCPSSVTPPPGANDCAGPDGVVAAFPWLFVTDANSRIVSFDLRTNPPTQVDDKTVSPGNPRRADELAYDPQHGILLIINNADDPPFGTLVTVNRTTGKLTVGTKISFTDATNGAEQPVWDPGSNRFYLSIPQIGPPPAPNQVNKNGAVMRINPFTATATVEATYPVHDCGPAGLTLGPHQDLFIGCNTVFDTQGNVWDPNGTVPADPRDVIINAQTGHIDATIFGVGAGDEVWFNSGDGNYYATGSGSPLRPLPAATAKGSTPAGVVDSKDEELVQLFPTYNVPAVTTGPVSAPHPAGTSHSIAANAANNHVFVPLPANNAVLSPDATKNCLTGCIAVFGHPDE